MQISERKIGNVRVFALAGKLTLGDGDETLRDACRGALERGERRFIFDFGGVPYMDSAGLGELIACAKRVRERSGQIRLVLSPKTREILTIAMVLRVFDVFDTVEHAAAGFDV